MANKEVTDVLLIVLAVIGALAVIAALSMWLMHATMMGGMMNCCGGMAGGWLIGLLAIAVLVTAAILLFRRNQQR